MATVVGRRRWPELGNHRPFNLKVNLLRDSEDILIGKSLGDGLRALYRRGEHCDVELICGDQAFMAHRAVLASQSEVLRQDLAVDPSIREVPARLELRLVGIANPEAVKFVLDFIYEVEEEGDMTKTHGIIKDIMRLAQRFQLPSLMESAMPWVATGITTDNAVERLSTCEEFNLAGLREQILTQLAQNKKALFEVAHSPQMMQHPKLMHALLQQVVLVDEASAPPSKKCRKAGG